MVSGATEMEIAPLDEPRRCSPVSNLFKMPPTSPNFLLVMHCCSHRGFYDGDDADNDDDGESNKISL